MGGRGYSFQKANWIEILRRPLADAKTQEAKLQVASRN